MSASRSTGSGSIGDGLPDLNLPSYDLLGKLGEGGMGVVYRARDKRLDRDVAIKVLPAEREGDTERLVRFEREAKILATLNHPNIAAIYDVGESGSTPYLVMELVEGPSLDRLIPRGGLDLERFFELATPLADALAAAHDKGVTHRDLKPSNVMVTEEGRVKVLDFGLAKLRHVGGDEDETRTLPDSVTGEGKIVGTVAYMSPEQAEGKAVDHRSDIFSLGVILYEMATGRRPFSGDSTLSTLTAILRDTPRAVTELRQDLPRHLARIIAHCLQKEPSRRYQSARDVVNELTELEREAENGELSEVLPKPPASRWLPVAWIVAAAVLAVVLVALLVGRSSESAGEADAPPAAVAFAERERLTLAPGLESEPSWSPDGRFVAYTAEGENGLDVLIRPVDGGESIPAVAHAADDAQPAWAPDGSRLAFVSARGRTGRLTGGVGFGGLLLLGAGGDIYIQPAFGGTTVRLAENGYYPTWSPDGTRIAFMSPREGPWEIWTVSADGGEPTRLENVPIGAYHPAWSPDGDWIATGSSADGDSAWGLGVYSVDGDKSTLLAVDDGWTLAPSWSRDGEWLYFTIGRADTAEIWRSRFSPTPEPALGPPERVVSGQGWSVGASISSDGRLAFSGLLVDDGIWEIDVASGETRQVTRETGTEGYPDVSPDGETLLAVSNRTGSTELWTFDLSGRAIASIGPLLATDFGGRWSPDGLRVAYSRLAGHGPTLAVQTVGELTYDLFDEPAFGVDWSPDGRQLVFSVPNREGPTSLHVRTLGDGTVRQLTDAQSVDTYPTWSADGEWIGFSREFTAGERQFWIKSPRTGEEKAVLNGPEEVSHPRFSRVDPTKILFLREHQSLWIMDINAGEQRQLIEISGTFSKLDHPSWGPLGDKIYYNRFDMTGDLYLAGPGAAPQN